MKKLYISIAQLWRAMRLVWVSAPGWTVVNVVVATVQGVIPVASLYLTKLLVDAGVAWLAQPALGSAQAAVVLLLVPVAGLLAVGGICGVLAAISSEAQSSAVSNHVQGILQAKALEVDYQCYENPAFHDTMRMAHGEAMSRPTRMTHNLTQSLRDALTLLAVAGVLAASHLYLAPLVLLAVIPGTVARVLNSRRMHAWQLRHMADERYAAYLNMLLTSVGFAKETRVFGHGPTILKQFRGMRERLRSGRLQLTRDRLLRQALADLLSLAVVAGGVALVALRLKTGQMAFSVGDVALLFRAFQRAKGALSGWLSSLTSLYEDSIFISHFYDFMALPASIRSPTIPQSLPASMTEGVALEAVSFRYPGTEREVLRDVSLAIRPGEHVAIVGENGAGKTTLAKLICRLYDPDSGRITIDGTDIRDVKIEELRGWMSVLFQDYARYFMSAEENIRMGDVSLPPHDARIQQAARRAGADTVIAELPQGYATPLGRLFDGGVELSVGQWQRVALARTLVRESSLVLLDEHTSALDPKAERAVLHQLFDSVKGKTVMIISHRLTTVTMVDRIIVMERGRVVEQGSHAELLARGGRYAALFVAEGGVGGRTETESCSS
ncbi:MAG: ABC transporter ATP-binding protein [Verrucomicrobia bacterium]|jgi:ATP-binding cassette, subfamily B, bacterial|nr:ABC transporter ATP-binding protein [Verrucomicrobiota bacterium]MBT7065518.1 ABC transporter ATP-binding protein [Verrucomicrobiota bacterium]MBT7700880.1 ABC transporter ATP-binding protein [Verrucomicrobiota bacterium]